MEKLGQVQGIPQQVSIVGLVYPGLNGCGPTDQSPQVVHGVLWPVPLSLPVQGGLCGRVRWIKHMNEITLHSESKVILLSTILQNIIGY